MGRRRVFIGGATVFGLGSLVAALSGSAAVLITGRALQGLGAAALAPASLALLMVVFVPGRDRDRALAVWGGVSASGTAVGLILGGVLTKFLTWPWVFWVTVPVAAVAVVSAGLVLPESRAACSERFDAAGALLVTAGLGGLVLGLVQSAEYGWTAPGALPVLFVAAGLLLAFGRLQVRRPHALVPTRLLRDPAMLGGNVTGLILGAVIWAMFYFLSLFMGGTLGYGPVMVGLAFLPMAAAIAAASALAGLVMRRTGPRPLLIFSTLLTTVALASLTRIAPDSTYPGALLPAFLLAGLGLGIAFVALATVAVGSAPAQDRGVAAALFNAGQQIGGAIGLAVLTAVSMARTRSPTVPGAEPAPDAITQGWSLGFVTATGLMLVGLLVIFATVRTRPMAVVSSRQGSASHRHGRTQ